jgi:hypothetical protein
MLDDPPTSSTCAMSAHVTPADATTRSSTASESASRGRTIASNSARVRRTDVRRFGSDTGISTSVSCDRCSLASWHSERSCISADLASGSAVSSANTWPSSTASTWAMIAWSKSTPPSRSTPSGVPTTDQAPSHRTTAASNVPPPRSYTATSDPSATRSRFATAAATGSGTSSTCSTPARAAVSRRRSSRNGPHDAGCDRPTAAGGAPSACSTRRNTSRNRWAVTTSAP